MSDESTKMSLNILMEMTDKYKDTMKEGDYLIMCNSLKELYKKNVDETREKGPAERAWDIWSNIGQRR